MNRYARELEREANDERQIKFDPMPAFWIASRNRSGS